MQIPTEVKFDEITIWVQCHNVPIDCMEPTIIRRIGERIGKVEDVDIGESGSCVGKFARIRVTRQIDQPLVRCVPLADEQATKEVSVILQYERLSNFCFACGRIGHISKDCTEFMAETSKLQYESWLRAGRHLGGRRTHAPGAGTSASSHRGHSTRSTESAGDKRMMENKGQLITIGGKEVGSDGGLKPNQTDGVRRIGVERNERGRNKMIAGIVSKEMGYAASGDESSVGRGHGGQQSQMEEEDDMIIRTTINSPKKEKRNPKGKGWKRLARSKMWRGGEEADRMEEEDRNGDDETRVGQKRVGAKGHDNERCGNKMKQRRLIDEEKEADFPTAEAAMQPRRSS